MGISIIPIRMHETGIFFLGERWIFRVNVGTVNMIYMDPVGFAFRHHVGKHMLFKLPVWMIVWKILEFVSLLFFSAKAV